MKNKNSWIIALVAIITTAFVGCGGNDETTHTHEWGTWEQTKAPTVEVEGEETRTCSTCGQTEKRPIDKLIGCDCDPVEHLGIGEDCDCGKAECNCTLKVYGTVADIPIYRSGEVTDEQMADAVAIALEAYSDGLDQNQKDALVGKIDAIHIGIATVANAYEMKDGKKVLTYRYTRTAVSVMTMFNNIGDGIMQLAQP